MQHGDIVQIQAGHKLQAAIYNRPVSNGRVEVITVTGAIREMPLSMVHELEEEDGGGALLGFVLAALSGALMTALIMWLVWG